LDGDSLKTASEESEGFFGNLIEVAGARLEGRELCECGELIE
jgi:RNA binding exosome subunit